MSEEEKALDIEEHQFVGDKYKQIVYDLEQTRAILINAYPKSSKAKEARKLETVIDNMKSIQARLHSRLLAEFANTHEDEDLLPIYLGRYLP
ncbi:MAG: hypothetical protein RLZZ135_2635 [Cyanobacteriota bacterium]|jgi:hypothetical protein